MRAVVFLFGCEQCRLPGVTDLVTLGTGLWAVIGFSVVLLAALVRWRRR